MEPMALYLVPVLGGIILTTYGFWIKKTDEKVDKHGERLAGLEALIPKMDKQLDRIEDKLNNGR
jgi:hypothetical protein